MRKDRIQDLLEYENESTYLDFKAIEYKKNRDENPEKKDTYADLIKDVMSMANADYNGDRYIIMGVKEKSDRTKEFLGLTELTDAATYQQLIFENIEPAVKITYEAFTYKEANLGILMISDCGDQPYCMKKDYGKLARGEAFIRRGTMQMRCTRSDFDRMYLNKVDNAFFNEEVYLTFSNSGKQEMEITTSDELSMPSDAAVDIMRKVLQVKQENNGYVMKKSRLLDLYKDVGFKYHSRSITELTADIENAKSDFQNQDNYYLFETVGSKLSLEISNRGSVYLQDVSIEMQIPVMQGLEVTDKIHTKLNFDLAVFPSNSKSPRYPKVSRQQSFYKVTENLGDVKHQIPVKVFAIPLRIFIASSLKGQTIPVKCKIFARNLKEPLTKDLKLTVL